MCIRDSYGYVTELPLWLGAADAVITKAGGLTLAEALAAGCPPFIIPVSYTHLDVYKRQPPKRSMPPQPARRLGNWALTSG